MKHEFFYAFLLVFLYLGLEVVSAFFIRSEAYRYVALFLNLFLVLGVVYAYYTYSPEPSANSFAVINLGVTVFFYLVFFGIFLTRGIAFLYSAFFWISLLERLGIPFIYEKYACEKEAR
ncbi:hypothetical protein HY571_00040 [Candidatus Micrarchaeota archaeon]|nr:hypothetical protein [Candidatus Micrarchaeota archaeon]